MHPNKYSFRRPVCDALVITFSLGFIMFLAVMAPRASQSNSSSDEICAECAEGFPSPSPSPTLTLDVPSLLPEASPAPDASPTASPDASPIASPDASPAASPESPATPDQPAVEIAKVKVETVGQTHSKEFTLVEGKSRKITITAYDNNDSVITNVNRELIPAKQGVVTVTSDDAIFTITGTGVTKEDSTTLKIVVNDQEQADQQLTVTVQEAVAKIEAEGGNAISLAEGDSFTLKFRIKGTRSNTLDAVAQPFEPPTVDDEIAGLIRYERDLVQGGFIISALTLPPGTRGPVIGDITFRASNGGDPLSVTVTVREKFGYITFEPPPRGFLMPQGSFTTLAVVRRKDGTPMSHYGVEFRAERESDLKWISLLPEGNKVTVTWNEPSDEEITKPDGTKEKRPSQVRIRAVARTGVAGEEITGFILVRMGEIKGFALVKVKLNLMDQVTAADLYGKVMSKEYYVLTVRMYNNLRDEITKEFTGDSILAYSSSIEVAVGLEKKFNPDSDSAFPNVIDKNAARKIEKKRRDAAVKFADNQADNEIAAATNAQTDLENAIRAERTALQEARAAREYALNLRDRLPMLDTHVKNSRARAARTRIANDRRDADRVKVAYDDAYNQALAATYTANVKIRRAHEASEETNRVRASIMRATKSRVTVSQDVMANSDPDTVIDDGRWHPVNPVDFNRISETEVPEAEDVPFLPPLDADPLGDNIQREHAVERVVVDDDQLEDPPCRRTITYRPFTFEMMVNTVDRRDGRSVRSKLFKILEAIGTGTSFVTSIAVPGNSSDLPLGLEKYGNLLIPGIDKLYPNYKEQNRQNIVAQAMKEIEEVPFGSDITRVIFIPKKTIRGLIRGHDTRISEICPFYFKIEVAIIKKRNTVQQGAVAP